MEWGSWRFRGAAGCQLSRGAAVGVRARQVASDPSAKGACSDIGSGSTSTEQRGVGGGDLRLRTEDKEEQRGLAGGVRHLC